MTQKISKSPTYIKLLARAKHLGGGLSAIVTTITPAMAEDILMHHNAHNRHVRPGVVNKYRDDVIAGNWMLTHQGIAFTVNGDLADGQHKLEAIIAAEKSVDMTVHFRAQEASDLGH